MIWVIGFAVVFGLAVLSLIVRAAKAGPREVSELDLDRADVLLRVTTEAPGDGWQELGSETTTDGLRLKFDHDDDPQAEATLLVPSPMTKNRHSHFGHTRTVRLGADFETFHVHTSGYIFRIRMRGTAAVAGKEVRIKMLVSGDGRPYGGCVENDDDTDAAVGDWIDVEFAEVLELIP